MKTPKEISDYYDDYSSRQQKMWHNERHYFLFDQLKKTGLKDNSIVLEIGCGIGTMTNLIAPFIKNGKIISSDISSKSIELAKTNNKEFKNIEFIVSDSTNSTFPVLDYDFIILFDVLEHIQTDYRSTLLSHISKVMKGKTQFLINVPAPLAHIHSIENFPEQMQLVEIPVFISDLAPLLAKNGFEIKSFFTYDMWQKEEYQFYQIELSQPYVFVKTTPDQKYNPNKLSSRIINKLKKAKNK